MTEEQAEAELARDPSKYLEQYYRNLNPPTADTLQKSMKHRLENLLQQTHQSML